jgi:hypothetical protein
MNDRFIELKDDGKHADPTKWEDTFQTQTGEHQCGGKRDCQVAEVDGGGGLESTVVISRPDRCSGPRGKQK